LSASICARKSAVTCAEHVEDQRICRVEGRAISSPGSSANRG